MPRTTPRGRMAKRRLYDQPRRPGLWRTMRPRGSISRIRTNPASRPKRALLKLTSDGPRTDGLSHLGSSKEPFRPEKKRAQKPMITPTDILLGKILIVDDQEANVALLEQVLREAGYSNVSSTNDSTKVCELHLQHHFDLILLDLLMPKMDGFQVMENLKEIEQGGYLPVLVITAQPAHKLRALQAGAKDFLSKPLDLAEVQLRVHNMLEVRLLHQETQNLCDRLLAEQKISGRMLLNALPTTLVDRLKKRPEFEAGVLPEIITESYAEVTVLFRDILEFTQFAEGASAEVLMGVLDDLSTRLDETPTSLGLDRNKSIDNAYLAAIPLTDAVADHTIKTAHKALDIMEAVDRFNKHSRYQLHLRIGLDTGTETSSLASRRTIIYDL